MRIHLNIKLQRDFSMTINAWSRCFSKIKLFNEDYFYSYKIGWVYLIQNLYFSYQIIDEISS